MAAHFSFGVKAALSAGLALAILGACTSYNPYTGQYDYDAGKTMAAVGTAALVGSVAHSYDRYDYRPPPVYRRPPHHHHYHHNRPHGRPAGRPPGRSHGRPPPRRGR